MINTKYANGCEVFTVDEVYHLPYYSEKPRFRVIANDHRRCSLGDTDVMFAPGTLDNFCVYLLYRDTYGRGFAIRPRDTYYFQELKDLAEFTSVQQVWCDIWRLFYKNGYDIDESVFVLIDTMVRSYPVSHQELAREAFTLLYYAMLAEDWREYAVLKRKIKMIGLYRYLIQNRSLYDSTDGLTGCSCSELLPEFGLIANQRPF